MRILLIPTAVLLGLFAALATPQATIAKCTPQPNLRAVSPDGAVELRLEGRFSRDFVLTRNGARVASGELVQHGHHSEAILRNDGVFALHDRYDGVAIYNADGTVRGHLAPRDLLTMREMQTRPGGWACHPEGDWARGLPAFVEGDRLRVTTHTGRTIHVDVATARVVEAEPDVLQAATFGAFAILPLVALAVAWVWWWRRPR